MIERAVFDELVKETAANLYDYAALEAQPLLFSVIHPPEVYSGSKIEYVRQVFTEAIQYFRPPAKEPNLTSPEWRPYLILQKRYIEGLGLQDLADALAISDRQLRRDHRRALSALAARLWTQTYPEPATPGEEEAAHIDVPPVQHEALRLQEMLSGVQKVMHGRVAETGIALQIELPSENLLVQADRIILRQILISLCSNALHAASAPVQVQTRTTDQNARVYFHISPLPGLDEEDLPLDVVRPWAARIGASVEIESSSTHITLALNLPLVKTGVILIIDDQQPAINMFQRYLTRSAYQVIGITHPEQTLAAARNYHPALILLDVMMPRMDGWELLQSLKLDADLSAIPVIVCSAWDEPDMARSLGAQRFLKKPVTQKALLDALRQAGLRVQD